LVDILKIENNKQISFLDILIKKTTAKFETQFFTKITNTGDCINFKSIAPDRYKTGVIKTMLHRAYKVSNNWFNFNSEIKRLKQLFTNNNFPMSVIDKEINAFMDKKLNIENNSNTEDTQFIDISFYYRNQMSSQYKQEEKNLRKIIHDNITAKENHKVNLFIYYKNLKLSNLLIKNNIHKNKINDHVVYQYNCNYTECKPDKFYIGYTTSSLKQRLLGHSQNGSIREHHEIQHGEKKKTAYLLENSTILHRSSDKLELQIAEALFIKSEKPTLNKQHEGEVRILRIF